MVERWILLGLSAVIILFGVLIKFGKSNSLIPGYNAGTPDEQKYMVRKKMGNFVGRQLILIGLAPALGVLLRQLGIVWGIEIGFGLLLLLVINMAMEIHRFTPPESDLNKKQVRLYWGAAGLLLIIMVGAGAYLYQSTQKPQYLLESGQLSIGGAYSTQIPFSDIKSVELREQVPLLNDKYNGLNFGHDYKGYFDVEGLGKSLVYINGKNGPVLVVFFNNGREPVLIKFDNPEQTKGLYRFFQADFELPSPS
jgi:hypothetical protein